MVWKVPPDGIFAFVVTDDISGVYPHRVGMWLETGQHYSDWWFDCPSQARTSRAGPPLLPG